MIVFILMQVLNEYFHNVCELDLVFNFYKVRLFFKILILFDLGQMRPVRPAQLKRIHTPLCCVAKTNFPHECHRDECVVTLACILSQLLVIFRL